MNQFNDQLFPTEFILNYMKNDSGKKRFLTYAAFRFFAFAGAKDAALPARLKDNLSCPFTPQAFTVIEDYLMEDYYFSPSLTQDTYEPLYLYAAISLMEAAHEKELTFFEELLIEYCPTAASLSYEEPALQLSALLETGVDFYAALYLAVTRHEASLPQLLPQFSDAYRRDYRFTCEDFVLFDFMDEYFEQKNCISDASFTELVDTLVTATLNYYKTDIQTLLAEDTAQALEGASSRFAGTKRFGGVIITASADKEARYRMLTEAFRYAAMYELRSNLFDFHLDDDRLITLSNWKENLRWHYVQYTNVYNMAFDTFCMEILTREFLKKQFADNLS